MTLADVPCHELEAEIRVRMDRGEMGYNGLFSSNQLDYHGIVSAFGVVLAACSNAEPERYWPIKAAFERIVDAGAPPPAVFALNTTHPGREGEYRVSSEAA